MCVGLEYEFSFSKKLSPTSPSIPQLYFTHKYFSIPPQAFVSVFREAITQLEHYDSPHLLGSPTHTEFIIFVVIYFSGEFCTNMDLGKNRDIPLCRVGTRRWDGEGPKMKWLIRVSVEYEKLIYFIPFPQNHSNMGITRYISSPAHRMKVN